MKVSTLNSADLETLVKAMMAATDVSKENAKQVVLGVMSRIESAMKKGAPLTPELIEAAIVHYFQCQEEFYKKMMDDKAYFNKFMEQVLGQI
jgi:hypothetical protein